MRLGKHEESLCLDGLLSPPSGEDVFVAFVRWYSTTNSIRLLNSFGKFNLST
jgi:hypothetical protein